MERIQPAADVPAPEPAANAWPSLALYRSLREQMAADPYWTDQILWQESARRPSDAGDMAREIAFVIVNSGMNHRVARPIYERVALELAAGRPIFPGAFRHVGKCTAIESIWARRDDLFGQLAGLSDAEMLEWCGRLPWVGPITKYHLAKNWGADVVKPDRWLDRIATKAGGTPLEVCQRLAEATGDRVATVDLVLWWSCANGHLRP